MLVDPLILCIWLFVFLFASRLNAQLNDNKYAITGAPYGYPSAHGLQIMPYQHQGLNTTPNPFYLPQQSATPNNNPTNVTPGAATKTLLTPEKLNNLYSMGTYAISPRPTPSPVTPQQPLQTASINPYVQPASAFGGAYPNIASPITSHILAQHNTLAHNQYHQTSALNAFSQQQQQQQQLLFNQSIAPSASVSSQSDSIASANYSTYIQNTSMHSSSPIQNQIAILRPIIGNVTNPESALVHVPKVSSYATETKKCFLLIYFHEIRSVSKH